MLSKAHEKIAILPQEIVKKKNGKNFVKNNLNISSNLSQAMG